MDISKAFPSKYLKALDDIPDDEAPIYTIRAVETETVGQGPDAVDKPVMYFDEVNKGLVLNRTNAGVVEKLYGRDTDDWIGRRVGLYVAEVQFKCEMVPAIRIKGRVPPERRRPESGPGPAQGRPDRTTVPPGRDGTIPSPSDNGCLPRPARPVAGRGLAGAGYPVPAVGRAVHPPDESCPGPDLRAGRGPTAARVAVDGASRQVVPRGREGADEATPAAPVPGGPVGPPRAEFLAEADRYAERMQADHDRP